MTDWKAWFENAQKDPEYQFELLAIEVAELMVVRMEALGLTRTALAKRLGFSPARVTQILAGDDNLTLKSLSALANALETRLAVSFDWEPSERWEDGSDANWTLQETKGADKTRIADRQLALVA